MLYEVITLPPAVAGGENPGQEPAGRRLDVPFDPGELAGEEQVRRPLDLQGALEGARRVDEGVAVHAPQAREAGLRQPRDGPEQALLLGMLEAGLET